MALEVNHVLSPESAMTLLRQLPGDARVLPQTLGGNLGLLFQFESGIQIMWQDGEFSLSASDRLRDDWAKWKAEQAPVEK